MSAINGNVHLERSESPGSHAGSHAPSVTTTRVVLFGDDYKPKLLKKAPSMRAIKNYNNISTNDDGGDESYDNLSFLTEEEACKVLRAKDKVNNNSNAKLLEDVVLPHVLLPGHIYTKEDEEYKDTMNSRISRSSHSVMSSEPEMHAEELGSTVKLISPKLQESCRTCVSYIETILYTVAFAAGFGNLYRLPLSVFANGGLPFFTAYLILTICLGLPLIFLELGIGQIVQDGFLKTTRAVPFFKGVGYIKLAAGYFLSLYYPLHMGLSLYYLIWFSKSTPPFIECATVRMGTEGYKADGISGQECVRKTFLYDAFDDPSWFGMYSGIVLLIWFLIMAWCIKRTKIYEKALIIFLLCAITCLVILIVKSAGLNDIEGINRFIKGTHDWALLGNADVWYYALIQVFFSTHIGFGVFTSNAGVIYKKVNPFTTAIGYMFTNVLLGTLAVFIFYTVSAAVDPTPLYQNGTIYEIHLFTYVYDVVLHSKGTDIQMWAIVAYLMIVFAGFLSVITIMYTMIKGIALELKNNVRWWQVNCIISFTGFVLGSAMLLSPDLSVIHLIDHYIVGNLVLISVILEVLAFIIFYGPTRLKADFEFILGSTLSHFWIVTWHICPLVLAGICIWTLATCSLSAFHGEEDPIWLFVIGWVVVLLAVFLILLMGCINVNKQEEYITFFDKVRASFRQARNWGPSDPMMLHNWKLWHSKAQDGERDFTLKRRGTKEYTHSVKNRSKYHSTTPTMSNSSTLSGSMQYKNNHDPNTNYSEPYYRESQLHVTSLIDAIDTTPVHTFSRESGYNTHYNPLAYVNSIHVNGYQDPPNDGSNSEGYGTYRKGPYIIEDDGVQHVCHRRNSIHEQATEL